MSTDLKAQFKQVSPIADSRVDSDAGIIKDVALISVGVAHGSINGKPTPAQVTMESLKAFYNLLKDSTIKAYINHGDDHTPVNPIGIFSGFYIDGEKQTLRASTFQALRAFKENSKAEYETLFELASKAPDAFGLSADFGLKLINSEGGGPQVVMPVMVNSFDFVNTPAATDGLFSREQKIIETQSQITLDEPKQANTQEALNETQSQQQPKTKPFSLMKSVFAHFSERPKALPFIAKFASELPEDAKPEDVIAKVEMALSAEEQAALVSERDALKSEVESLKAKIAELSPKEEEVGEMGKKLADLEAKFSAVSSENLELKKLTARFGVRPINTGAFAKEQEPAKTMTRAEWSKLPPAEQGEFFKKNGKLTD